MTKYKIEYLQEAKEDLKKLKLAGEKRVLKRIKLLIEEIFTQKQEKEDLKKYPSEA